MQARALHVLLAVWCSAASLSAQDPRGRPARVAYSADEAQNDVFELFGVPLDGSAPSARLNSALPAGGDVATVFAPAPAHLEQVGERVLYIADQLTDGVHELFSVSDDASSPPVKLNGPMVTGGDVSTFMLARRRVVYLADQTVDNRDALFSVPFDGSAAPVPLTPSLGDVDRLVLLSRDASLAVFTLAASVKELLYVVRTDGSQPPLLLADSGTPTGFIAHTYFSEIQIAPDGLQVVYIATENDDDKGVFGDIFSARLDGSTPPVKLNPGGRFVSYDFGSQFRIAPDGQRVLYGHDDFVDVKLHSVRLDGTGLVDLVPGGESGDPFHFCISADSEHAFFASHDGGGWRLRRSRLDGSESLTILSPIAEPFLAMQLAPGGASLVFALGSFGNDTGLYSLQLSNLLLSQIGDGVDVGITNGFEPLAFTPDGLRIVFRGVTAGVTELYSALLDGSQPAVRLNPSLSGSLDVLTFRLAPDGKRALYQADQAADDVFELFSVPVDGSSAAVRLNQTPVTGGDVTTYTQPVPGQARRLSLK